MSNMIIDSTSYTNKDFRTIFPELLELTKSLTNLWDPVNSNESDPGVVLLKLQAFIADKLNYNIDKNILENFPSSVTQRGNAQKLYELMGYNMKWYQSATTEVVFKYAKGDNSSDLDLDSYIIPKYTQLKDDKGSIVYTLLNNAIIYTDNSSVATINTLTAMEGSYHTYTINGTDLITINNLDADNRLYFNETQIASNGIFIHNYEVEELWEITDNLDATQLGQKVFKFGVLPNSNTCYIQFPQDAPEIFGRGIQIGYIISSGADGNIGAKVLTQLLNELTIEENDQTYEVSKYTRVTNPKVATNGKNPESLTEAYKNYQKTIGTFKTLVTLRDYEGAIYNEDVVSNCVVSDRTCDLNKSYKVRTKSLGGDEFKSFTTTELASLSVLRDGQTEIQYRDQPSMNAFNIAVYALNKIPTIYDETTYNHTFTTGYQAQTAAQESIKDYKSVQHDWIDVINQGTIFPYLFKNLISLNGKVFTHQKVSAIEAEQIEKNINIKLYQTYYSRNVSFGQEIEYDDLIETILAADTRIKNVILDDPEINSYVMKSDNTIYPLDYIQSEDSESIQETINQLKLELIAKSILAGVTPWCTFDKSLQLAYTLKPAESYIQNPTDETLLKNAIDESGNITLAESATSTKLNNENSSISNITAITTQVDIPLTAAGYTLRNNETVFFYSPSYLTTKQLSTYLYVYLKTGASAVTIPANGLYELRSDDILYVTENSKDLIELKKNLSYVCSKRAWPFKSTADSPIIIKPSFQLKSNQVCDENTVESFNLESTNTIDLMEINKGIINETKNELGQIRKKDIYAVWVVDNLNNQLFTDWHDDGEFTYSEHILQSNELFIYTDSAKSDLVLLQSGTKLSVKAPKNSAAENFADDWTCSTISLEDVQKNGTSANFDWKPINRILTFTVQEMQIETVGAGCTIYYKECSDAGCEACDTSPLTKLNNQPQPIVHPDKISWSVDNNLHTLPVIDTEDNSQYGWVGFSRLSLVATSAHPFTLAQYEKDSSTKGSFQKICLFKSELIYDNTLQKEVLEYKPVALLGPGQSLATSAVTMLTGGIQQSTAILQSDQTFTNALTASIYKFCDIGDEENAVSLMEDSTGGIVTESYESNYFKFQFIPSANGTVMTANMELSGLFKNVIIPIALSSISDYKLEILNIPTIDKCSINIPDNNSEDITLVPPESEEENKTIIFTNNLVYYLYVNDITEHNFKLQFKLNEINADKEIIAFSENPDPVVLTMFTPVKIKNISSILNIKSGPSGNEQTVLDVINRLATLKVNLNDSFGTNQFDYTYEVDEDNQILDPLDPSSFYNSNHIYNKYVISQLNTKELNIKIARQSKQ